MGFFKWKWTSTIISLSHGWKMAYLILVYMISTTSERVEMNRKPFVWASRFPWVFLPAKTGRIVRSDNRGTLSFLVRTSFSCATRFASSNSRISAARARFRSSDICRKAYSRKTQCQFSVQRIILTNNFNTHLNQVAPIQTTEGHFTDKGCIWRIFLDKLRHIGWCILSNSYASRVKIDS